MANKKYLDPEKHGTKGIKMRIKYGLTGREVSGEGYCKKAHMRYKFVNFNKEGVTNKLEWISG